MEQLLGGEDSCAGSAPIPQMYVQVEQRPVIKTANNNHGGGHVTHSPGDTTTNGQPLLGRAGAGPDRYTVTVKLELPKRDEAHENFLGEDSQQVITQAWTLEASAGSLLISALYISLSSPVQSIHWNC